MGKIKCKRLRVSRFSPTHLNSKGQNKNGKCIAPKIQHSSPSKPELSRLSDFSCGDNFMEMEEHNIEGHGNHIIAVKGGLKTALDKVLSGIDGDKITGLNMLAAFALDNAGVQALMENDIIATVAPLLRDNSSQIRLSAVGLLRNLCTSGLDEVIDMMVQQDVLQPLNQLLKTYEATVPSSSDNSLNFTKGLATSTEESDSNNLVFIHATNVLWSLCEYNEEALSIFNQENLVNVLLKHINPFEWSFSMSLAAADCLLCVSEDNPKAASAIFPFAAMLDGIVLKTIGSSDTQSLHFAVVISGVLLNINYWTPGDSQSRQVFTVLSKVLELDTSLWDQNCQPEDRRGMALHESFEHITSAQLIAFEILSNICCPDDEEEDDWEECNDMTDEDMHLHYGMQVEDKANLSSVSIEVVESIKFHHLAEFTLKKIAFWKLENHSAAEKHSQRKEKFILVQVRILQCLQNLLSCLTVEDLGGANSLHSAWLEIWNMMFGPEAYSDENIKDAASGAMRAIVQKLSEGEYTILHSITEEELQVLSNAGSCCDFPSVRANICRMVGVLGCSLIKCSKEDLQLPVFRLLFCITEFLLKIGSEDDILWVRAEALDALIDIYSDDITDKLAAHACLVERLKEIQPCFKAKFNQQKKTLGDHRPLVLTVRDNLVAFIKYKGRRAVKYTKILE